MNSISKANLVKVDELKQQLAGLRPLEGSALIRLQEEFMIESTYNSNAIEGNKLTLRETALLLQEGITVAGKSIKDHLEAISHREAFEYMINASDSGAQLTERLIKEIHSLVLNHDTRYRGIYRDIPVRILGASHTPPQPYLIRPQMEALILDYHGEMNELHPLESISLFHLRFEGIHPFVDGNGRTGRLLINLELIKAGYLPINIKFTDRDKYYACFDSYYGDTATPDTLTNLIIDYEIAELNRYIDILKYAGDQSGRD